MGGEFRKKSATVALGPHWWGLSAGSLWEAGTGKVSSIILTSVAVSEAESVRATQ